MWARLAIATILVAIVVADGIQPNGDQCGLLPNKLAIPRPLPPIKNAVARHVSVMIRHGDRTPVSHPSPSYACWPNAPAWNCTFEPEDLTADVAHLYRLYQRQYIPGRNLNPGTCFAGQLTDRGIWQEIANGKILRQAYVNELKLLPPNFDQSIAYLRSDDVPRVILSAEALLMGLYPVNTSQPQCVIPTPWNLENILPNPNVCPMVGYMMNAWKNSSSYLSHYNSVTLPLDTVIGNIINVPMPYLTYDTIQDCFIATSCHNFPFPNGVTQQLYNAAMADAIYTYSSLMNYSSPLGTNWATMSMASFVQDMMAEIDAALVGGSGRRFALYAGHDTSVLPFLKAFNIYDGLHWPRYASMIRIELYESTITQGQYLVRVIYNDKEMLLPGCNNVSPCPYPVFQSIANDIISTQTECTAVPPPPPPHSNFGMRERVMRN